MAADEHRLTLMKTDILSAFISVYRRLIEIVSQLLKQQLVAMRIISPIVRLTLLIGMSSYAFSQPAYDLLLQGGHVIDPKNGISAVRDVAIKDGAIAAVALHLDPAAALKVVNVASNSAMPCPGRTQQPPKPGLGGAPTMNTLPGQSRTVPRQIPMHGPAGAGATMICSFASAASLGNHKPIARGWLDGP